MSAMHLTAAVASPSALWLDTVLTTTASLMLNFTSSSCFCPPCCQFFSPSPLTISSHHLSCFCPVPPSPVTIPCHHPVTIFCPRLPSPSPVTTLLHHLFLQ